MSAYAELNVGASLAWLGAPVPKAVDVTLVGVLLGAEIEATCTKEITPCQKKAVPPPMTVAATPTAQDPCLRKPPDGCA